MWRCPNCETLNDGERCVVCDEAKPTVVYDFNPQPPVRETTRPTSPSYSTTVKRYPSPSSRVDFSHADSFDSEAKRLEAEVDERKKKNAIIMKIVSILIVLGIIVLLGLEVVYQHVNAALDREEYNETSGIYASAFLEQYPANVTMEYEYQNADDLLVHVGYKNI